MTGSSDIRIVLLGPPGSGKGTQTRLLSERLGVPFVVASTVISEVLPTLPEEQCKEYEAMRHRGDILPPGVVAEWLVERVRHLFEVGQGVLIDGSPRSVKEAESLAEKGLLWKTFRVFYLKVDDDVSLERMRWRRECARCKQPFPHTKEFEDVTRCGKCGGELVKRKDASEEVLANRVATYHRETKPVVGYFQKLGVLTEVNGEQTIDEVHTELLRHLGVNVRPS